MEYFLLIAGFIILIYSGQFLVKSSVSIAHRLRLSSLVIGMTVVAMGTSAPELLVSISAVIKDHPDVAVYNVIGSNISNILLVLAVASLIFPMPVRKTILVKDWPVLMMASILFYVLILNHELDRLEGILFVVLLVLFTVFSIYYSGRMNKTKMEKNEHQIYSLPLSLFLVVLTTAGLAFGADLLVANATVIARKVGVSDRIISVTLVAVGTSIPELTTSIIAAFRKETDISVGNIIGSNIFNIFFILGITSIIKPVPINPLALDFDIYWLLGVSFLIFLLIILPGKMILMRWKGLIMFLVYLMYLYVIFNRI